jgi:hypothetical protein
MTDGVEERKKFVRAFVKAHPLEPHGARLYAALSEKYPGITSGGHRGMVGRMYEDGKPWEITKSCPNVDKGTCTTVAASMVDALEMFGVRCKGRNLQSYCKKCRNEHRRKMREVRKSKSKSNE